MMLLGVQLVLGRLLQSFRVRAQEGVEVPARLSVTLRPANGVPIHVSKRS